MPKTDQDQDRLNPGNQHYQGLTGGDQAPGSTDMSDFESRGVMSQGDVDKSRQGFYKPDASAEDGKKAAGKAEEKVAIGDTAAGKTAAAAATAAGSPIAGAIVKVLSKVKLNKESSLATVVIGLIVVGFVGISSFLPVLGPIAFVTNIIDDLNDQLAFVDVNDQKILRTKLSRVDENFLNGCQTRISIRCKLKSLSTKEVQRLQREGIKVNEKRRIGNRVFIASYEVDGNVLDTGRKLRNAFRSNPEIRLQFKAARASKFHSLNDRVSRWFSRAAGASRVKPKLAGDTVDAKFANLAKGTPRGSLEVEGLRPIPDDPDGRYVDENGKTYTEQEAKDYQDRKTKLSNLGSAHAGSMLSKSVSIMGAADIACAVKNTVGMAGVLSEVIKNWKLMEYAAPVAASTYAIQAGEGDSEDGEVVGRFIMDMDTRRQVEDVEATLAKSLEGVSDDDPREIEDIALAETVYKPNPDYGKNATDAPVYQTIAHGTNFTPTEASEPYSLKSTATAWGAVFGLTAAFFDNIPGTSERDCDFIQSWYMRGLGMVIGVGLLFVPGAQGITLGNIARNIGVFATAFVMLNILGKVVNNLANGQVVPDDIVDKPVERGSAMTVGLGLHTSYAAQGRGMKPSSKEEFMDYRKYALESANDYKTIATRNSGFFDTTNPYSPVNQIATALNPHRIKNYDLPSMIASTRSLIRGSASSITSYSALAAEDNYANRFDSCIPNEGDELVELGVDLDIMCNVRYSVSDEIMNLGVDETLDYMIDNGYINEDSGLPEGYTFPDPDQSSNFATDLLIGIVNEFYATRNYSVMGDYAKFLDYCAYRTMPLGNTYEETGAFGSAGRDWVNGKKCVEDSEVMNYFRAYTGIYSGADITEVPLDDMNSGDTGPTEPPLFGQPENTRKVGEGWDFIKGEDYSQYSCADGTVDNGVYTNTASGITMRLCGFAGHNVASVISQNIVALFDEAKSQGINMTIQSGHRTYEFQMELWKSRGCDYQQCNVAAPGTSNHENGLAVDLGLSGMSFCYPPNHGRVPTCPGNIGYEFMVRNGARYGFYKLPSEAWHWQTPQE